MFAAIVQKSVCLFSAARAALHISDELFVQKEVVVWQLLAATERSEEWIEEKAAELPEPAVFGKPSQ